MSQLLVHLLSAGFQVINFTFLGSNVFPEVSDLFIEDKLELVQFLCLFFISKNIFFSMVDDSVFYSDLCFLLCPFVLQFFFDFFLLANRALQVNNLPFESLNF